MKKSLLLCTTLISLGLPSVFAAEGAPVTRGINVEASNSSVVASKTDLGKIKQHILGYAQTLGLPSDVQTVSSAGCFACCSTAFNKVEEALLQEVAGQLLVRFLAIALDDVADGTLDGVVNGQKISYAKEIGQMLGISIDDTELKSIQLDDQSLMSRLVSLSGDIISVAVKSNGEKDEILKHLKELATKKMNKARKNLAVAMIQETDRIIELELGNGAIDGLDRNGSKIDWRSEMKQSIQTAIQKVLYGVL